MEYGDLGKRIFAWIIDVVIIGAIGFVLGWLAAFLGLWLLVFSPFISFGYYILMEGGSWHATLGKRAMGLYVGDANGNGISYSTAILRTLGKILSGLVLCLGYIMCFFNGDKQCLHDMLAKTYVYSGQSAESINYDNVGRLVCLTGSLAGTIYTIPQQGLVIGRDSKTCNVAVPPTQQNVSRVHCYITYNPMSKMFILSDRNSSLGTFLDNGTRVMPSSPAALSRGRRFYLASRDNMFEVK